MIRIAIQESRQRPKERLPVIIRVEEYPIGCQRGGVVDKPVMQVPSGTQVGVVRGNRVADLVLVEIGYHRWLTRAEERAENRHVHQVRGDDQVIGLPGLPDHPRKGHRRPVHAPLPMARRQLQDIDLMTRNRPVFIRPAPVRASIKGLKQTNLQRIRFHAGRRGSGHTGEAPRQCPPRSGTATCGERRASAT